MTGKTQANARCSKQYIQSDNCSILPEVLILINLALSDLSDFWGSVVCVFAYFNI